MALREGDLRRGSEWGPREPQWGSGAGPRTWPQGHLPSVSVGVKTMASAPPKSLLGVPAPSPSLSTLTAAMDTSTAGLRGTSGPHDSPDVQTLKFITLSAFVVM